MKKINIVGYEESPFSGQEFALLSGIKNKDCHILVEFSSCRGWMSDAIFDYKMTGTAFNSTNTNNINFEKFFNIKEGNTTIGITFFNLNMKNTFLSNMQILHSKEQLGRVKKTKIYDTQDNLVVIAEGSKFWKDSCWKIQLYTFYLRSMCYKDIKSIYTSTWKRLEYMDNELVLLSKLKYQKEIFTNLGSIHAQTGPDAICRSDMGYKNRAMANILGVTPL